jgi:hypothetical protein
MPWWYDGGDEKAEVASDSNNHTLLSSVISHALHNLILIIVWLFTIAWFYHSTTSESMSIICAQHTSWDSFFSTIFVAPVNARMTASLRERLIN